MKLHTEYAIELTIFVGLYACTTEEGVFSGLQAAKITFLLLLRSADLLRYLRGESRLDLDRMSAWETFLESKDDFARHLEPLEILEDEALAFHA